MRREKCLIHENVSRQYEIRRPYTGIKRVIVYITCDDCRDKCVNISEFTCDKDLLEYTQSLIVCGYTYKTD